MRASNVTHFTKVAVFAAAHHELQLVFEAGGRHDCCVAGCLLFREGVES